jgi:hypothetical protein
MHRFALALLAFGWLGCGSEPPESSTATRRDGVTAPLVVCPLGTHQVCTDTSNQYSCVAYGASAECTRNDGKIWIGCCVP